MSRIIKPAIKALFIALLLSVLSARAQTIPECEPNTQFNRAASGSELVWHWSTDGVAASWWCLGIVDGVGKARRFTYGGRWADGWAAVQAAAPRVQASPTPWQAFQAEALAITAALPVLAPGSAEECQRRTVHHGACVSLHTATFDPPFPRPLTRTEALGASKCGPAPVCTVAPAWVVDVGTDATKTTRPAFPLVNGVRSDTSTARATSGQPCRPEVAQAPSLVAGKVFAAFGPAYSPTMVALCRRP